MSVTMFLVIWSVVVVVLLGLGVFINVKISQAKYSLFPADYIDYNIIGGHAGRIKMKCSEDDTWTELDFPYKAVYGASYHDGLEYELVIVSPHEMPSRFLDGKFDISFTEIKGGAGVGCPTLHNAECTGYSRWKENGKEKWHITYKSNEVE